jgi:KUP system potassium uptake protein
MGTDRSRQSSKGLVLAALGIVFGDIGTSPLYAFRECIAGEHGVEPTRANVLGVLSLVVWSLTLVVTLKYMTFVMRADNHGEGGIFALLALLPERLRSRGAHLTWIAAFVLVGAALLFGDGMITPAISVLSAVEGLETEAHALGPYVVPITCAILVLLFVVQRHGTESVGRFFGPIMLTWFVTIAALGLWHVVQNPSVLSAADPRHAVRFFGAHGIRGFKVLGAVVLAVTGGEALYADMGHFGRAPIRMAWLALVFPSLLLAYFGMGALVLAHPALGVQPFYSMVVRGPHTYVLVGLSTAATVIASQALISGSYSLTHQAVQLGYFPRVLIKHTSRTTMGQIYVPFINWVVGCVCILLVLTFRQSSKLAAAYGIAVTGTMSITSVIFFFVTREVWRWRLVKSLSLLAFFLSFDLAFLGANAFKLFEGGWVPVLVGACFFITMLVWWRGRNLLAGHSELRAQRPEPFFATACGEGGPPGARLQARTSGTGVFLTAATQGVPHIVVRQIERVHVLPERVVLVTIRTADVPYVPDDERATVEPMGKGFYRVIGHYGFRESPDVPNLIARDAKARGLEITPEDTTYFLGRETILGLPGGTMGHLEETFFAFLWRNARHPEQHFKLPPQQVIEVGLQVDL